MPAGDGTGPRGMGPMSGRRAGFCAGFDTPGYANPVSGRGYGMGMGFGGGRGRGRGWRNQYYATGIPGWGRYAYAPPYYGAPELGNVPYGTAPTTEQETMMLRSQAETLKKQLEAINQRLSEMEQDR